MAVRIFRAADKVEISGIYRVSHYQHRLPHEITILAGERFPPCHSCGEHVRFELVRAAAHAKQDRDLSEDTGT